MKVQVGHLVFHVRRMTDEQRDKVSALGICHMHRGVIEISWHNTAQEEASTLMHEVLHAIHHAYALTDKVGEERLCRTLEGPLVAFMQDNPQVVAAIIAASEGVSLPIH